MIIKFEMLIAWFFFLFVLPEKSYAYLDPGTGSYLYQLALAGLFSGIFFFSAIVKKLVQKFKKKNIQTKTAEHDNGQV